MGINPLHLVRLKDKYKVFKKEHPDMTEFFKALNKYALVNGTTLEIRATTPEGRTLKNAMILTDNDVEIVKLFVNSKEKDK